MTKKMFLKELEIAASHRDLHSAVFFYFAPLSECVELRRMYSESRTELYLWLEEKSKFSTQCGIDFKAYLDGDLQFDGGDFFEHIKEV